MSIFKKLEKDMKKAAHNVCNPNELKELDKLVEKLHGKFDNWIKDYPNDGTPPNKSQAADEETAKFASLNAEYDKEAEDSCDRKPKDKDDNISVRKRQLNRGLESRRGKLFRKFSGEVAALTELAASTLRTAIATTDDFDDVIRAQMPMPVEALMSEFDKMKSDIEAQIDSSFPGASEGLENYDDSLPADVCSYKDLKARWPGLLQTCLEENAAKIDETVAKVKESEGAALRDAVKAVLDAQRAENASLSLNWLPADRMEALRNELDEMTYNYGIPRE